MIASQPAGKELACQIKGGSQNCILKIDQRRGHNGAARFPYANGTGPSKNSLRPESQLISWQQSNTVYPERVDGLSGAVGYNPAPETWPALQFNQSE